MQILWCFRQPQIPQDQVDGQQLVPNASMFDQARELWASLSESTFNAIATASNWSLHDGFWSLQKSQICRISKKKSRFANVALVWCRASASLRCRKNISRSWFYQGRPGTETCSEIQDMTHLYFGALIGLLLWLCRMSTHIFPQAAPSLVARACALTRHKSLQGETLFWNECEVKRW